MQKATILGGDRRLLFAALWLKEHGYEVTLCATAEKPSGFCWVARPDGLCGDLLILPIPLSRDGIATNGAPHVPVGDVAKLCAAFSCVCGGGFSESFLKAAREQGGDARDLLCDEQFTLENAHLTAQAATGMLLCELTRAPKDAEVLLLGFGRIAQALCPLLLAHGYGVSVCARSPLARKEALLLGAKEAFDTAFLATACQGKHALLNTAPARLCDEKALASLSRGALLMELASGNNLPPTLPEGLRLMRAPGLPGKVFPFSAGALVGEAAHRFLTQKTRNSP